MLMPALATARASDEGATRAYLRASDAYGLEMSAALDARIGAMQARASDIGSECPSALLFAPRDEAFAQMSEEIGRAVWLAGAAAERAVMLRYAQAIEHLSWSNSRVTRLVRLRAAEEGGVATAVLPNVCADLASWKAGAYGALPTSVSEFLAHANALEAESFVGLSEESRERAIMRLLRTYENPLEQRLGARVERLEAQSYKRVTSAISPAEAKLAAVLGAVVL
jgi:hypothetical protein